MDAGAVATVPLKKSLRSFLLRTDVWSVRIFGLCLVVWGLALGAWVATGLVVSVLLLTTRRRGWLSTLVVCTLLTGTVTLGSAETLWRVDQIGERARKGDLSMRDQVAVYGFNTVFGMSALVLGFPEFGVETLSMGIPISLSGTCPEPRRSRYRRSVQGIPGDLDPPLRSWNSDFAMRSPRVRSTVRKWARSLPSQADEGATRRFGPASGWVWQGSDYWEETKANGVAAALNSPTTRLEGTATRTGDRWRMDLVVHLAVAYPKKATMHLGPFSLEEGMWYDSRSILQPYCGEYKWSVWSDSPELDVKEAQRPLREQASTWILREAKAFY